jgi:DNA modification methylase
MSIRFHEGDSYQILRKLIDAGTRVASCVTDPPYGLTSIVDRFGKEESKAALFGSDGAFGRISGGFMGQKWDASGIEKDPEFWKLVFEIILPGGYIVAFSSARTYHHMATAIELAGFTTHPMIGWAYASGLPKPHNPKVAGFEESRHGAQVRKPALEPIYVGQKPYEGGSVAANIRKHGVGAVHVDGANDPDIRWPANLMTDGSPEVAALFPNSEGQRGASATTGRESGRIYYPRGERSQVAIPRGDSGNAIRFFEQYPFEDEPLFYNQKAGKADRAGSDHATVKPIKLMRALVRHVTPPGMTVLDPFAGSGTTGVAASLEERPSILIEGQQKYANDIRRRMLDLTEAGAAYFKALGVEQR